MTQPTEPIEGMMVNIPENAKKMVIVTDSLPPCPDVDIETNGVLSDKGYESATASTAANNPEGR